MESSCCLGMGMAVALYVRRMGMESGFRHLCYGYGFFVGMFILKSMFYDANDRRFK